MRSGASTTAAINDEAGSNRLLDLMESRDMLLSGVSVLDDNDVSNKLMIFLVKLHF